MLVRITGLKGALIWLGALCLSFPLMAQTQQPPALIVQIVVDQLRGDLLQKYENKFTENGFNHLLKNGINFQNTHHPHAHTVTCAGHATIATGAYPALHGIVGNDWYDSIQRKNVYCTEDKAHPLLPNRFTQSILPGHSPKNLIASTFTDELVLAQKGRAFSVSLKDRAAIMLAGHAGKAFWYDKKNGGFVSSRYYYSTYPKWVLDWNQHYQPAPYLWTPLQEKSSYRFAKAPLAKHRFPEFGFEFPHNTGEPDSVSYAKFLSMTPWADEITADFALRLLKEEKLGQTPGKTDYLAVSFSALDAIGHQFGPNSIESEDHLLRLDKIMATMLQTIEKHNGLSNTLIIFSADHGVDDSYVYLNAHNMPHYQPISLAITKAKIEQTLKQHDLPNNALAEIAPPFIYLNHQVINKQEQSHRSIVKAIIEQLNQIPGVYKAYDTQQNLSGWMGEKVAKTAFPERSGDIYVVFKPYITFSDEKECRVSHGSPWNYDSHVPLIFLVPHAKARKVTTKIYTTDIAPTLSALLQINAPSAAVGRILDIY